jgi:hypothetical protein
MPSRYDDEDDDYDDRPRKRKKAKKKGGPPIVLFAALAGGLLVAVGVAVGGYLLFSSKPAGGGGGPLGGVLGALDSAPPGYTAVRDADGGFAVALPGRANKAMTVVDGKQVDSKTKAVWGGGDDRGELHVRVMSAPLPAGYTPGTTPELMEKLLRMAEGGIDTPWNEVVSKGPVTLDGKPAFELRYRYKPDWMGAGKGGGGASSRYDQTILCVTTDGKRLYLLKFDRKGRMADDETVKTVYDSFRFI